MSSSSSSLSQRGSAPHRTVNQTPAGATISVGHHRSSSAVDPAPKALPVLQFLALGLMVTLAVLQFLPATHFRLPSDPHRNWLPLNDSLSVRDSNVSSIKAAAGEDGMVHIVSWMESFDVPALSILANSTLSNSRNADLIYFHFFVPGGDEDKRSFYKLKVLFPHSNIEIYGQERVKNIISNSMPDAQSDFEKLVPFVIPSTIQLLGKFIYFTPKLIIQGRVEDLISVDLQTYGIAASEDCSKILNTLLNMEALGFQDTL